MRPCSAAGRSGATACFFDRQLDPLISDIMVRNEPYAPLAPLTHLRIFGLCFDRSHVVSEQHGGNLAGMLANNIATACLPAATFAAYSLGVIDKNRCKTVTAFTGSIRPIAHHVAYKNS
jgi:hypothetical protein